MSSILFVYLLVCLFFVISMYFLLLFHLVYTPSSSSHPCVSFLTQRLPSSFLRHFLYVFSPSWLLSLVAFLPSLFICFFPQQSPPPPSPPRYNFPFLFIVFNQFNNASVLPFLLWFFPLALLFFCGCRIHFCFFL